MPDAAPAEPLTATDPLGLPRAGEAVTAQDKIAAAHAILAGWAETPPEGEPMADMLLGAIHEAGAILRDLVDGRAVEMAECAMFSAGYEAGETNTTPASAGDLISRAAAREVCRSWFREAQRRISGQPITHARVAAESQQDVAYVIERGIRALPSGDDLRGEVERLTAERDEAETRLGVVWKERSAFEAKCAALTVRADAAIAALVTERAAHDVSADALRFYSTGKTFVAKVDFSADFTAAPILQDRGRIAREALATHAKLRGGV